VVNPTAQATKAGPNRSTFTPFALKRIPIPPSTGGRVVQKDYWDSTVPGFGLRISSTGTRTWTMLARVLRHGRPTLSRLTIGRYAEKDGDGGGLTLATARRRAYEFKESIKRNEDPRAVKETAQQEMLRRSRHTFETVVEEFLRVHHPVNKTALRPASLRRYKLVLAGPDLAHWRTRPIASITRRDVLDALHRMQARGLGVSCNRALAALRVLSRWAVQRGYLETTPTDSITPIAAEISRDRHLFGDADHDRPSEIALLWNACDAVGPFGAIPQLLLLTGQRRDEVTGMNDAELIDLAGKNPRWSIPPERTKNNKRHLVPLAPAAVALIQHMPRLVGSPLLFTTTGTTPFSGFSNLKEKIDQTIETLKTKHPAKYARQFTEEWRFHDLRRTCKTAWADLGVASDVRDALLGHAKPGMDRVYDHSTLTPEKRAAMVLWGKHVSGLVRADEGQATKRKR
jgi:integrase